MLSLYVESPSHVLWMRIIAATFGPLLVVLVVVLLFHCYFVLFYITVTE